jgi:hypothetical protein
MYCPTNGSVTNSLSMQFAAFSTDLNPGSVIRVGSQILLKSLKTGMFCRLVSGPTGQQEVRCDIDAAQAAELATPLTYDGTGVSYNGVPLTNPGTNDMGTNPLYLGGPGTPATLLPGELSTPHGSVCVLTAAACSPLLQPTHLDAAAVH